MKYTQTNLPPFMALKLSFILFCLFVFAHKYFQQEFINQIVNISPLLFIDMCL